MLLAHGFQGYGPSWWGRHGCRSVRLLVTWHPQSETREKWKAGAQLTFSGSFSDSAATSTVSLHPSVQPSGKHPQTCPVVSLLGGSRSGPQ